MPDTMKPAAAGFIVCEAQVGKIFPMLRRLSFSDSVTAATKLTRTE
jgi:hypothetical protein